MNSLSSNLLRVASLALALPALGLCAAVQINGVCIQGNCVTPTPVAYGSTESGSTSTGIVLNTDSFNVSTTYQAGTTSTGGTFVNFYPVATYIGSKASTGTETLTIDLFATIYDSNVANWDGKYNENVPLIITNDSTGKGELFVDGQGIGQVGYYGPGTYFPPTVSKTLTGLNGSSLNYDYQFVFNFTPGVTPGGFDASPASVPEPTQMIPAALSLAGFALVALRRRKQ